MLSHGENELHLTEKQVNIELKDESASSFTWA